MCQQRKAKVCPYEANHDGWVDLETNDDKIKTSMFQAQLELPANNSNEQENWLKISVRKKLDQTYESYAAPGCTIGQNYRTTFTIRESGKQ